MWRRNFVRLRQGLAIACTVLVAGCPETRSYMATSNNRIQYYLDREVYRLKSKNRFQEFISRDLGSEFSDQDFVVYMEDNEATCKRYNTTSYISCKYLDFKETIIPFDSKWNSKQYLVFCFWKLPSKNKPLVKGRQISAHIIQEWPSIRRQDFALAANVPDCPSPYEGQENGDEK